jgi:peptidyl-prolyl cis-trans isomerase C
MRLLSLMFILGLCPTLTPAQDKKEVPPTIEKAPQEDKVVATVYGAAIKDSKVKARQQHMIRSMVQSGRVPAQQAPMLMGMVRQQAIDMMINEALLGHDMKAKNLQLTDAYIDGLVKQEVDGILKRYNWDLEEFKQQVQKQMNISYEKFVQQMKTDPDFLADLRLTYVLELNYKDQLKVSDQEVSQYYQDNPDRYKTPAEVRASHILLKTEGMDDAGKKEARTKIDKIMADAQKPGADFAALAQTHSDCPSKTKGGDLDFFAKERMVPPFSKAAFATATGQIHAEIVETQFGYHIIKVTDKKAARTIPFAEAKDGVRATLVNQKKNESTKDCYQKLSAQAGDNVKRLEKPAMPSMPGMPGMPPGAAKK